MKRNKFTSFKELLFNGGIEDAAYLRIADKIQESNRKTIHLFSIIACIALFILLVGSLVIPSLSAYMGVYAAGFLISVIVWAIAQFAGAKSNAAMTVDVYLFASMLMGIGIALGTFMSPSEIAATYIAILLAVPQVLTDRPIRMHLFIVISIVVFIICTLLFKDAVTQSSDITNAAVFGIVTIIICTYSIKTRITRYYLEYQIRFLAENDQLTGLLNRHSYQNFLDKTSVLDSNTIFCVYVDVNGLHELNNTRGHDAGDRMLQFVASVMQNLFGKENCYRIGGDEFVALGMDKQHSEIQSLVHSMKQAVEAAGYHVAAGIGMRGKEAIQMDSVIKSAETEMYRDKAEFYKSSGNDRRHIR